MEERVQSSIPRGETAAEGHWTYPSPGAFVRALAAKGKAQCSETEAPLVVDIHNAVNEQTWALIRRSESSLGNAAPRLVSFVGRPCVLSPRAWWNVYVRGTVAPFDRHDWHVLRPDGRTVRYVIDFYLGARSDAAPSAIHIDARCAVDSVGSLCDRLLLFWRSLSVT
jgi:cytochrome c heme-lyase